MEAAGEAPDASTTLFQDCRVAVAQVAQAPPDAYAVRMTLCAWFLQESTLQNLEVIRGSWCC